MLYTRNKIIIILVQLYQRRRTSKGIKIIADP